MSGARRSPTARRRHQCLGRCGPASASHVSGRPPAACGRRPGTFAPVVSGQSPRPAKTGARFHGPAPRATVPVGGILETSPGVSDGPAR